MANLVDELVLLAVEDDGRISHTAGTNAFRLALIGAALIDLSFRGRLDADLHNIRVMSVEKTGVPPLDLVIGRLSLGQAQSCESTVLSLYEVSDTLVRLTLQSLIDQGILGRTEKQLFWVFNERRYPVVYGVEQTEAKVRILTTLRGDQLPTPHDTVLIGLARTGGLLEGFMSDAEINRLTDRLNLVGGVDLIARGVEMAIYADNLSRAQTLMFMG
jgi:golgi phosphoprotein 3